MTGDSSKGTFSTLPLGFLLAFSTGSVGAHVLLFFFRLGPVNPSDLHIVNTNGAGFRLW